MWDSCYVYVVQHSTWHVLCVRPMEIIIIISLLCVRVLSGAGVCAYVCMWTENNFLFHSSLTTHCIL